MVELRWEGKYDKDGRKVAPPRIALPFQTVETVNESMQERQRALDLFSGGGEPDWRNRLIWGDKKYVLPSLLPEFAGKVNLIYIDPPFDTGADFSFSTTIPDSNETFVKEPSVIEQKAYRDTWGKGLDSYLKWFYETVALLRNLLADDGSIYIHLDYHVGHYAKTVLDEVFGQDHFGSEIIWKRTSAHSSADRYGPIHDVIFFYTKSEKFTWNPSYQPYGDAYLDEFYNHVDADGRRWKRTDLTGAGVRRGATGEVWRGINVTAKGRHWSLPPAELDKLDTEGLIHWPAKDSGMPRLKQYADEAAGLPLQDIWTDISPLHNLTQERTGYATQKPEALVERIVKTSSNERDLVLDCFCGSGTSAAVAEKLNRCWITCDLGRFAVHTARKRLLSIPNVKPFMVQNLGKYERQAWQAAEFGDQAEARQNAYRCFILDLYKARPVSGHVWLHGVKAGKMIHIGSVDSPVSVGDVQNIAVEFRRAMGSGQDAPTHNGVDLLGWDFAFEVNETARQQAALANINMRFLRIPREVLEKKAVEQGDIRFFELAALSVEAQTAGRSVTLTLSDFVIPIDDVPEDVQRAIKQWDQWVDYWAVDWDHRGDTFHNQWQTYRTRKDRALQKKSAHKQAILDAIVKRPVKGLAAGIAERPSDIASVRYQAYLTAGVERWREYKEQLKPLKKKPLLFVMMNDTTEADDVAEYLKVKYPDEFGGDRLLVIHTDKSGEVSKKDLDMARTVARSVDETDSPVNAIVSVLMLREGWDVQNVTVIVGLRPYSSKAAILPEQTIGRGLRLMFRGQGTHYVERVDVIGNKKFIEFVEQLEKEEDIQLETFEVGKDRLSVVTIQPDPARIDRDISLPVLSPMLTRKKTLADEIAALDIGGMACPKLPMKDNDEVAQQFHYEGYDILTLQKLIERDYTIPTPQTSQEVISYYARRIAQDVKLPSQFAALVPKVRQFLEQRAFGQPVTLDSPAMLKAISSNVAQYVTVKTFAGALRGLVVEAQTPQLMHAGRKLSETAPFPYSRPTVNAAKSVFNLVPCDNEFERRFALFLQDAADIAAFAKLPSPFGFAIDYTDSATNLRYYEPDFVAVLADGSHWLIETKGREDIDVAHKDRAATHWCENATLLTGTSWCYLKVPQTEFDKLQPALFADLTVFMPVN